MTTKNILISLILLLVLAGGGVIFRLSQTAKSSITNFIECKNAGYPIMESYPAQCRDASGHNFIEEIKDTPTEIPAPETTVFNKTVSLNLHEKTTFPDGFITLTEINDSRCKPGVQCIWAGELSATFALSRGFEIQKEIILGTTTAPHVTVNGYAFSLQNITEKSATITVTHNTAYTPPTGENTTPSKPKPTSTCTPSSSSFTCEYVTQGYEPNPSNPPPKVCGCKPASCPDGQSIVVSSDTGYWPDGSAKGTFTCSTEFPA